MRILFIFLDGVGLGAADPETNPLARADMPTVEALLSGHKLLAATAPAHTERATLLAIDAGLGVPGLPQSATGQAVLLTGVNVPAAIGEHYGPKPNAAVARFITTRQHFLAINFGREARGTVECLSTALLSRRELWSAAVLRDSSCRDQCGRAAV